jgi:hypothetical protein
VAGGVKAQVTIAAGAATGAPVIDLSLPNNGDYTSGAVGAFFCNDHTHFEAYGAQQIAAVAADALRSQNIPLATYLK